MIEALPADRVRPAQKRPPHAPVDAVINPHIRIDSGCKRLLWIGQERTTKTFLRFFCWLGKVRSRGLKFICSDMWQPYLNVIAKRASQAIHVLDRFHIMQKLNKAIDEVRAGESKQMAADGYEPILKHSRW